MNNLAPELVVQECTTNTQQESYHSILSNRSDGLSGKPTTDHILSLSIHEDNIFTGCPLRIQGTDMCLSVKYSLKLFVQTHSSPPLKSRGRQKASPKWRFT